MTGIRHIRIVLLFTTIVFFQLYSAKAQTGTIWEEDFTYSNGTTTATKDGVSWSTTGIYNNEGIGIYYNQLLGRRTNQGSRDTWITDTPIDISGYLNVSISVDVSSSSNLESNNDYIQLQYSLDGGTTWTIFENNGYLRGNISGTVSSSQTGLEGTSLLLTIIMRNSRSDEYYYADNVLVTGLMSVEPSCASLSFPANGATGVSLNSNLDWNADLYSTDYYLYFGTDNPPSNLVNGSSYSTTFYAPPEDLNTNTTYYWQVVPYNSSGSASGCPVWSFTTGTTASVDTTIRQLFNNGEDLVFTFPFNGCAIIADGLLTVTAKGDINRNALNEFYNINGESGLIGRLGPTYSGLENCDIETVPFTIDINDIQNFASDNTITFVADPQSGVDEFCPNDDPSYVEMNLKYSYVTIPTCMIDAPSTVCMNEQNISVSAPDEMETYSWNITSGDAVINGSNSTQNILINAGTDNFTVELYVESYPGCSSACSINVSVQSDGENPSITCAIPDANYNVTSGQCFYTVPGTLLDPTIVEDNCGIASFSNDFNNFSSLSGAQIPVGETTINWTAIDNNGNSATCSQTINVSDNINPVISGCPSDISLPVQFGRTGRTVTWTPPTASDNCNVTLTSSHNPGDFFNVGTTTVSYTATDDALNTATCSFDVEVYTVVSACSPNLLTNGSFETPVTSNWTIYTNSQVDGWTSSLNEIEIWASGGGGGQTSFEGNQLAEMNGNGAATFYQDVATTPGVTMHWQIVHQSRSGGDETIELKLGAPGSSVFIETITSNGSGWHVYGGEYTIPEGQNTTRFEIVSVSPSGSSGNLIDDIQFYTIEANPPTVENPTNDITVENLTGECYAVVNYTAPTFQDDCDGTNLNGTLIAGLSSGSQFPMGATTVTYEYTDGAGNGPVTSSFVVTVSDKEDPQITCPSTLVLLTDPGLCTASGVNLGTPSTSDNCMVASVSNDVVKPYEIGDNIVTWTVLDAVGNSATCQQTVTVQPEETIDVQIEVLGNSCQNGATGSQTTITWEISKLTGDDIWSFDYAISDGTGVVASGTKTGLTGSGTQISFVMDNSTGVDQTFTLTISNVQDECTTEQNTTNNTDSVILWGLPVLGNIE